MTRALTVHPSRLPEGRAARGDALQKCQTRSERCPTESMTRMIRNVVSHGHRLVLIGAKPRIAAVQSAANFAIVLVQNDIFAIHSAAELGRGDFHCSRFVAWNAGVGDSDSPQQRGFEFARRRNRVHIASFIADFVGNARVIRNYESKWTRRAASRRGHAKSRSNALMWYERHNLFGKKQR